ncbi:MAG: ADP-ribosylglycohydrolase family protein, partial [Gemmatimonadetes bacterium]|nr:ADP-ribosylglycohydrolase family protein [Gemmatimonadota bacterium]
LDSDPFDCGFTTRSGLRGTRDQNSQANGAMMRISPLGIFGANYESEQVAEWAREDAALTHPHPVCQQANSLYASAIAYAVRTGCEPHYLYERIKTWAENIPAEPTLMSAIDGAATAPPVDYVHQQGWVLTAFRNALWQLLHAENFEQAVVDTVHRGGDTDTNAAICGALLGAVHGREAVPERWVNRLLRCRPQEGDPNVLRPRPECYWPVDALELAERLISPSQ